MTQCGDSSAPFLAAFRKRAVQRRIPLHGTFALTYRCNLQCRHCYAAPCAHPACDELTTDEILAIAREAVSMGCLSILLTGGEPLLRPDFCEIYTALRRMGLFVELFTNATLIDDAILECLRRSPPQLVEVTVYGATPQTAERVTGRASAFDDAMVGIERMRGAGLRLRLKSILMTLNEHEFEAMAALASPNDTAPFRFDSALMPRFNGDQDVLALRLPPERVVALENRIVEDMDEQWKRQWRVAQPDGKPDDRLYNCGVGQTAFYVDPVGMLQPCVSAVRVQYDLRRGTFRRGWEEFIPQIRERRAPPGFPCGGCEDRAFCGACPPFFDLENGDETCPSAYLCDVARLRGKELRRKGVLWHDSDSSVVRGECK